MGKLLQSFDASQFDPSQGASQLPRGKHPVIIESSSVETTKDGGSGMVVLSLRVIDGPDKGASGPYRLNLYNQSSKASEIAHRQLSALCYVTNVFKIDSTEQLHNIPFIIEVGLQRDPESAAKGYTEVQRVFDMNGNEPGKASNGGFQQQQPQNQPAAQGGAWGGGQPAQQQPAQQGAAAGGWGGQPQGQQPQGQQAPAGNGAWGGGAAAGGQPAQQQQPAQNGNGWGGGQPQQQQPQGNPGGGWQQQPQGNNTGNGAAPWGR